jgi:TetR/AcrR family transcriptional regulator, transcriptional repressor for nem operon
VGRPRKLSDEEVVDAALLCFWQQGSRASVEDVVAATGVNRAGLYGRLGGKDGLFEAALQRYSDTFVTEAFGPVEAPGADLSAVDAYFEGLVLWLGEEGGRPGPGCLMTNTMVDAPHRSVEATALAQLHYERMVRGFENALCGETGRRRSSRPIRNLAVMLATFAQGFFAVSRMPDDLDGLRVAHRTVLEAVRAQLDSMAARRSRSDHEY